MATNRDLPRGSRIRQLAAREGILSLSPSVYPDVRTFLSYAVARVIELCYPVVRARKHKTVSEEDVHFVLRICGISQLSYTSRQLVCSKTSFALLCREHARKHTQDPRFSAAALTLVQGFVEHLIGTVLSRCTLLLYQQSKVILRPQHFRGVLAILKPHLTPLVSLAAGQPDKLNTLPRRTLSDLLRTMDSTMSLSSGARAQLGELSLSVISRLLAVANGILTVSKKQTLSALHLQSALRMIASGSLRDILVRNSTNLLTRYSNAIAKGEGRSVIATAYPISRAENIIRSTVEIRLSRASPVYLASVIDTLLSELLEGAVEQARLQKRVRISSFHVITALRSDKELSALFLRTLYVVAD